MSHLNQFILYKVLNYSHYKKNIYLLKMLKSIVLYDETIWLPLNKIAELFEKDKSTISEHIKNIFEEQELDKI